MELRNWKKYKDDLKLTTDGLWLSNFGRYSGAFILPKRDSSEIFVPPKRDIFCDFDSSFHGLFIPEIPYQFIIRFAKDSGWIWDCFAGSGTTHYVANKLGCVNRCIVNDIEATKSYIIEADSKEFNPLKYSNNEKIRLLFFHPPYFDIVKFTDKDQDLSLCENLDKFLVEINKVVKNVVQYVSGFVILICGNIYYKGEEIDLGVIVKEMFRSCGLKCKSHIIKDYGETKAKGSGYSLQYYRNLKNNTNFFYGDNIFILQSI